MSRRIIYLLIPFILGCNFLFPRATQMPTALPTQGGDLSALPVESATPIASALPTATASPVNSAPAFQINRIHIAHGSLYEQLVREARKAKEMNLNPFLEFDATWCPPCIAIEKSLNAKDEITLKAFAGTYIIRADVDEWGWGDKDKFKFKGIPVYFKLDYAGNPAGAVVDGDAWGDNIPDNFAPVLDEFFHAP